MSEPISDARLKMIRRRFDNLDESMRNLDPNQLYDPVEMMKEAFRAAKCIPELLDEIERLKEGGDVGPQAEESR